jgi:hypothetical protein
MRVLLYFCTRLHIFIQNSCHKRTVCFDYLFQQRLQYYFCCCENRITIVKKVKCTLVQALRLCTGRTLKCTDVQALRLCTGRTAHRGSRGIALPFHDHGTRRGWGVSVTPRPIFTPDKDPVHVVQEAGWALGPVWTGVENLAWNELLWYKNIRLWHTFHIWTERWHFIIFN